MQPHRPWGPGVVEKLIEEETAALFSFADDLQQQLPEDFYDFEPVLCSAEPSFGFREPEEVIAEVPAPVNPEPRFKALQPRKPVEVKPRRKCLSVAQLKAMQDGEP